MSYLGYFSRSIQRISLISLVKKQGSGRPDQANTGLTEPDWSGNFYRTEPDLTEPDLIAYKFSNIPSFKVSETLNYEN